MKLVAIDSLHRVALVRHPNSRWWFLPEAAVNSDEDYVDALVRLRLTHLGGLPTRWGNVVGNHLHPATSGAEPKLKTRYFIARVDAEPPNDDRSASPLWAPRGVIRLWLPEAEADRVCPLIDGYLDGWLPDGSITLS